MNSREAALKALAGQRRHGVRLDTALAGSVKGLSPRDSALAARLCYGVVQNRSLIDLALREYVKKAQPQVLDILRLGAYQLWYLDRIPRRALTDEAVRLCKKTAPHAAGLVNAVLRRLPDKPPKTDDLSVKYSLPPWFCEKMASLLPPDELEPFFISCNTVPPIYIQGNPLHDMPDGGTMRLPAAAGRELDDILRSGRGIVADPAAKLAVKALDPQPGMRVWDTCAAPGGKTLMAAFSMQNKGTILATDKSEGKLPLIRQSLARCRITNTEVRQADASSFAPGALFDAVLCDVPCSGFGVLRKKPDIRYRTKVGHFPALQLSILQNAAKSVKDGGTLVYCTCTLLPEENEGVIEAFLAENGAFALDRMETLWPHRQDTDGFFICKLKR